MALIAVNWRPNRDELRTFGFICFVAFGALGTWIRYGGSLFGMSVAAESARTALDILWALALLCLVGALVVPTWLRPLYVALTAVSLPIGFVVSHVLMAFVFYGLITPIGLFFRVTGRDVLQRRFDPAANSYWTSRTEVTEKNRYFRQF